MATYVLIEEFLRGPGPVYARFRERGRMAPDGLRYVNSWVTTDGSRCYQVMECDDRLLLEQWMEAWNDVIRFEVVEVTTSDAAARRFAPPE